MFQTILEQLGHAAQPQKMVKQITHLRKLLLHGRKHEELALFVVPVDLLRFGHKAQRSDPSQPAAGTGHFVQVILDTLGQRLSLHLCQGGGDIHHGPAKGRGGVEVVADGDKGDVVTLKIVQQLGKIAHIAANAVQTVAAQHLKFAGTHVLDHLRIGRTVGAFAGKALVLVIDEIMRVVEAAVAVFAAHGDLIGDGFAGGRKLAFARVDGDVHGVPPPFDVVEWGHLQSIDLCRRMALFTGIIAAFLCFRKSDLNGIFHV